MMSGVHLSEVKSGCDLDVPVYPQAPSHLPPQLHLSLCAGLRPSLQLLSASFSTHVQGLLQSGHLLWCPPVTFRGNLKCLAQATRLASLCRTLEVTLHRGALASVPSLHEVLGVPSALPYSFASVGSPVLVLPSPGPLPPHRPQPQSQLLIRAYMKRDKFQLCDPAGPCCTLSWHLLLTEFREQLSRSVLGFRRPAPCGRAGASPAYRRLLCRPLASCPAAPRPKGVGTEHTQWRAGGVTDPNSRATSHASERLTQ